MTPEQAKAAREQLAKWDALTRERDQLLTMITDYMRDSGCNVQIENKKGRLTVPHSMYAQARDAIRQVFDNRIAEIEREKQELKIDG